jgi:hypothetical protein
MPVGRIGDVQSRLIRGKGQAVRQGKVVDQQAQGAVRVKTVDAIVGQLLARDGRGPPSWRPRHARGAGLDGVGWVGEVDGAVGLHHDVVGAVEPLAFEALRQHRAGAVVRDASNAAAVVPGRQHSALAIQRQAIGHPRGIGGQLRALRQPAPAYNTFIGNIAKEQVCTAPYRAFRKPQPAGDALDGGVGGNQIMQSRVIDF